MTAAADRAAEAERRGATYWLLARLVAEPPLAELLSELDRALASRPRGSELPLAGEVERLAVAVTHALRQEPPEVELRAEHTRLWGGLSPSYGPPPPYESVLREDRLPGDATTSVALAYAQAELDPEVAELGPADHLVNELRFLALCCAREAAGWNAADHRAAALWLERQRAFLDDHVLAWVPLHCLQVAESSRTDYHRAVGLLIARACELDRSELDPAPDESASPQRRSVR